MASIITLRDLEKPLKAGVEADLDWFCKSLGFVSSRDADETASRIFRSIVLSACVEKELTSQNIAEQINISRGAVLAHIKNYMDSGLIIQKKTRYILRRKSLNGTLEELELDAGRLFQNIKKFAQELDIRIGLMGR